MVRPATASDLRRDVRDAILRRAGMPVSRPREALRGGGSDATCLCGIDAGIIWMY